MSQDQDQSRVLATIDRSTMARLAQLKFLISGLRGLGSETAKNLILFGPAKVSIYDDRIVDIRDLGSNCFLKEEDVGVKTRAQASLPGLRNLNSCVQVEVVSGPIENIEEFDLLILTESDPNTVDRLSQACRQSGKGFIYAESLGAAGFVFVDFGDGFHMTNRSGRDPETYMIKNITKTGTVTFLLDDNKSHDFREGDIVLIEDVEGMTEVNGRRWEVKQIESSGSVEIGDLGEVGEYLKNGVGREIKRAQAIPFKSWSENQVDPQYVGSAYCQDTTKNGKTRQLHLSFQALRQFQRSHDRLPGLLNIEDADECVSIAEAINAQTPQVESLNVDYPRFLSLYAQTQPSPFATFWSGIIAQEAIKFTGSYRPLNQLIYYDWFALVRTPATRILSKDRYADQTALLGLEMTQKLLKLNVFLVGAGALGCEFLKGLALMGGACGGGKVDVTDDDHIELSNLSRQFLFHREHIGQSKSAVAAAAARLMNPSLSVISRQERVCQQTEDLYNEAFWQAQDIVLSAVDNVKARAFLDAQCVWYQKPFLESGTKGLSGSSMLILPGVTKTYGDLGLSDDKQGVANCTLKRFPYQVDHCIEWARNMFEYYFSEGPREAQKYILDPSAYHSFIETHLNVRDQRVRLEQIETIVKCAQRHSFTYCVQMARDLFQVQLHNEILQLTHALPADHRTQDGRLFWTAPKRFPHPLDFDQSDDMMIGLIFAAANLYAEVVGLPKERDKTCVQKLSVDTTELAFHPVSVVIDTSETAPMVESYDDDAKFIQRVKEGELPSTELQIKPINFEKDDDSNFHIDFIHALGCLRSRNYEIPPVDRLKTRLIAGKIIPAVTTSGASITGAVLIELYKLLQGLSREEFRGWYFDLGTNYTVVTKPSPAIPIEVSEQRQIGTFTTWSKMTLTGPLSLKGFIDAVEAMKGAKLVMACYGETVFYGLEPVQFEMLEKSLEETIEKVVGTPFPKWKTNVRIDVYCTDKDGHELKVPAIRYNIYR